MRVKRIIPALAAVLAISAVTLSVALSPRLALAAGPRLSANVQVNQPAGAFPTNKQNEPSIAQNPTNPNHLVAGSNDEIGEPLCTTNPATGAGACPFAPNVNSAGFYASFDGGQTWPTTCQGLISLGNSGEFSDGDPAQAFDSRGNVYYGTLAAPFPGTTPEQANGNQEDVFVAKSTDGGCHYTTAVKISGASPAIFDDKDAITADASPTSPFRDTVYFTWTRFNKQFGDQIMIASSSDGGATWSNPSPISPAFNNNSAGGRQGSAVKVGPDGTVYVTWLDTFQKSAIERMAISHDGGKTFPKNNVTVATVTDDSVSPTPGSSYRQDSRTFPSLSVGANGALYVAWSNRTNGHAVVQLVRSSDGGKTWSAPVTAGNVAGRSAVFASVAADPTGKVNVAFTAQDDKPAGTAPGAGVVFYDAYFTQSSDGGATFSAPLKISTASSDPDGSSTNSLAVQFLGDYITVVADGTHAFAVWTDSRNATPCAAVDTWRAAIAAGQSALRPNPDTACPGTSFGNTDIFLGIVSY